MYLRKIQTILTRNESRNVVDCWGLAGLLTRLLGTHQVLFLQRVKKKTENIKLKAEVTVNNWRVVGECSNRGKVVIMSSKYRDISGEHKPV